MSANTTMQVGQCWMSESEPELGLGFISEVSQQIVTVRFPGASQERRYGRRSAPLKRVEWQVGDKVRSKSGLSLTIERAETRDGLIWYQGQEKEICESDVSPKTKLLGPAGRLLSGHWDAPLSFELRKQTLHYWSRAMSSPVRGLLGPRVELIPHQVYVVTEVASRALPRVLLADEVGLGKTIEAGWIAHQLLVTGRISRVLVLAPSAMVNQWFVEMRRRFNLTFRVPESEETGELFTAHQQLILSVESLKHEEVREALESAKWDLVIVDEAHRITWAPENPSPEYQCLQNISQVSRGLLLLTATPEQLGIEGHFGRLHLLDPQRFASYEAYLKEHDRYAAVVKKAERLEGEELRDLIDRHGTGRVYIRNARKVVEAESYRFPRRIVRIAKLDAQGERVRWLKKLLEDHSSDKFLLICSSREEVERIEAELKTLTRVNTTVFHEGQSLVVRDRSAAYFADPQGARLLLSSEIGSEGRNFQFARHLILWDLPEDPDVLEQRIGRLDRIGQRQEFTIHIPLPEGSREEMLYEWYDEVFGIFDQPASGAAEVHAQYYPFEPKSLSAKIKKAKADYKKKREALENGRDRLIEINSFDPKAALSRVKLLEREEHADELRDYMEGLFSWVGVNEEDLDEDSVFVEPGDAMFIPVFPGLPDEGVRITYSRRKALEREDLTLLSWDHPMVRQSMEMIVAQEFGNVTVARWKETGIRRAPLVECYFILQSAADPQWYGDEFFPPHPIRVVLDAQGKLATKQWPADTLAKEISRVKVRPDEWQRFSLRAQLKQFTELAAKAAQAEANAYREKATGQMQAKISEELTRLHALAKKNGLVSPQEIKWWLDRIEYLEQAYKKVDLRLDSIRVIFS